METKVPGLVWLSDAHVQCSGLSRLRCRLRDGCLRRSGGLDGVLLLDSSVCGAVSGWLRGCWGCAFAGTCLGDEGLERMD